MLIDKNIEIRDLGLYLVKKKILVIGDIHIGYEEALNKSGMLIPRFAFNDLKRRIEKILKDLELEKIIINGDLKHEFGTISKTEWDQTLEFITILQKKCKEVILIKGNHDTILGPIAKVKNLIVNKYYKAEDTLICHGDEIVGEEKIIIIGHMHPAVGLKENNRVELFKCFLKGKYKGRTLIVMPSFNLVTQGSDILQEEIISPYVKNIENFKLFVVGEEKVFDFRRVKDVLSHNNQH